MKALKISTGESLPLESLDSVAAFCNDSPDQYAAFAVVLLSLLRKVHLKTDLKLDVLSDVSDIADGLSPPSDSPLWSSVLSR